MQYCDRECQRLHWFAHKKLCARPISTQTAASGSDANKATKIKTEIDSTEISEQLQNLITQ